MALTTKYFRTFAKFDLNRDSWTRTWLADPTESAPPDCAEMCDRSYGFYPRRIRDRYGLTHQRAVVPKATAEDRGA